ncbi:NAD(P)/FAD-dependent oxidoreductase [Blastococcus sp. TF02A-26]|uniref:NAD(P)/FAD-dependent oxidoreductase n=1 Tax=Blastococcus sp. TF02A-26 TaxID=2250577 RepID=UPI000DEB0327|nr:NAD(P)/FAD-dependent oxidoreductase [Blastococcus sp. TF02A-26]RBY85906.1 thioredoxin reductase [Blastococcus sp. TF02A-26]
MSERVDVLVIGGGAAGLSGALALARARRSVLVVDGGTPRNAPAAGVHNFLTRDGTPPAEVVAAGRAEVAAYGGEVRDGWVTGARRVDGGFEVALADGGTVVARRLLVATGVRDELPDVPGLVELWGTDVLHCPYCHGWEVRDQPVGILSGSAMSTHAALLWSQWTPDVTLFLHTGPEPTEEQWEQLAARGVEVVTGEVVGLETADGRLSGVRLADGTVVPRRALVAQTRVGAPEELLAELGLVPEEVGMNGVVFGRVLPTGADGATSVPGVWIAGNAGDVRAQVVVAAAQGLAAAGQINMDLVMEETRAAVAARTEVGAA